MVESAWWTRMRWRRRGAWQWPAFAALTLLDVLLIALLPFQGDGPDVLGAALLAGFFNLLMVAVAGPLAGVPLRRVRRDLPAIIARDYASTALLVAVSIGLLAGGIAHRAARAADRAALASVSASVHNYVLAQAPSFHVGLASLDTVRLETAFYRSCVYRPEEKLPLCLLVNTDQAPAGVVRDPDRTPNTGYRR